MHFSKVVISSALVATSFASLVKRQDTSPDADGDDSATGGDGGCMRACEAAANEAMEGHCDNSTWTGLLDDCLGCANTAGFVADYEEPVTSNADNCGIAAQFLPSAIEDGDDMDDGLPGSTPDTGPDADTDDSSPDSDTMPDTGPDADTDDSSPDSDTMPDTGPDADSDDSQPDSTADATAPSETAPAATSAAADSGAASMSTPFTTTALVGLLAAVFAYAL